MKGIFAIISFKGIDEKFLGNNYFNSADTEIKKGKNFIFVVGKNFGLTESNYHYDERFEILSISRIDNKANLLRENSLAKETSNSELILFLYKKFKTQAFNKIFGGFSAIIFDKKLNKIRVFTDHLNLKPLFYTKFDKSIFFSSSIESLFQAGVKRNLICEKILLDFLVCGVPRLNKTIYKNISVLPTNYSLNFDVEEKIRLKKIFAFKNLNNINFQDKSDYQKKVKEIFFNTVEEQLNQTETNVSLALSGGLDSSSVVCVADSINKKKGLNKNLFTNSAIFPALQGEEKQKADEVNFIKLVIEKINLSHKNHEFSDKGSLSILNELTNFNEPMLGVNAYINFNILETVRLKNHNVYFDGNGGDNTISHGYSRFFQMGRNFNFYNLFLEYRAYCKKKKIKFNFFYVFKRFVLLQLIPDFLHRYLYSRRKNKIDFFDINSILKKNKRINILKRIEKVHGFHPRAIYSRKYPVDFFEEKSVADLHNTYEARLNFELSEKKEIEMLSPFLDKRLMEFCLQVPLSEKFKNGEDRYYFRKAMKYIIPMEIEYRTSKADISPLFLAEILNFPLDKIIEIVFNEKSPLANLFEKEILISLHKDLLEKKDLVIASIFYKLIYLGSWINKRLTKEVS